MWIFQSYGHIVHHLHHMWCRKINGYCVKKTFRSLWFKWGQILFSFCVCLIPQNISWNECSAPCTVPTSCFCYGSYNLHLHVCSIFQLGTWSHLSYHHVRNVTYVCQSIIPACQLFYIWGVYSSMNLYAKPHWPVPAVSLVNMTGLTAAEWQSYTCISPVTHLGICIMN